MLLTVGILGFHYQELKYRGAERKGEFPRSHSSLPPSCAINSLESSWGALLGIQTQRHSIVDPVVQFWDWFQVQLCSREFTKACVLITISLHHVFQRPNLQNWTWWGEHWGLVSNNFQFQPGLSHISIIRSTVCSSRTTSVSPALWDSWTQGTDSYPSWWGTRWSLSCDNCWSSGGIYLFYNISF